MKVIKGDLIRLAFEGKFDVIVHGCNCFHTMGAGIARQIWNIIPKALEIDKKTGYKDRNKLGDYSSLEVKTKTGSFILVNAYTQFHFTGAHPVDYDAIKKVFGKIINDFKGLRIGYPKIGCGLAGGDWDIVSKIINEELEGEDHTLTIF